eukprot:1588418-Pyramimonas_sp.AAC.1
MIPAVWPWPPDQGAGQDDHVCVRGGTHAVRPSCLTRVCSKASGGAAGNHGAGTVSRMMELARKGVHPKTGERLEPL